MNDEMGDFRALKRQITWDMINHPDMYRAEVQEKFGLAPASEDVLDMEHAASDRRLFALNPVYPRVRKLTSLASTVAHQAMLNNYGVSDSDDDNSQALAVVGTVCMALTTAVLASLLEEGLIVLGQEGHIHA